MHTRLARFPLVIALVAIPWALLTGCPGTPGIIIDDDCEVSFTAVADAEPWFLVTDSSRTVEGLTYFTMSGVGTRVEQVSILAPPYEGSGCASATASADSADTDGLGTFQIENQQVRVDLEFLAADGQTTCTFSLVADVARCGEEETFIPLNAFGVVASQARLSGEAVELAAMDLLRFRQPQPASCSDPFMTLPDEWTLSNISPVENLVPMPVPGRVEVVAHGMGEVINTVDITGSSVSCFADAGTITFDGTTLTLDVPEGMLNEPPSPEVTPLPGKGGVSLQRPPGGEEGGCSVQYTGTVADCDFYVLTFAGYGPVAYEILRLDGDGQYTRGDVAGDLDTMYLYRRQGGDGLCGIGMIFAFPIMFLGLSALRGGPGRATRNRMR